MQTFAPSFLDKLLDAGAAGPRATSVRQSIEQVRESVARDIEMFLNAHRPQSPEGLSAYPHVAASLLTLGLVDIAPLSLASDVDRRRIGEAIRSGLALHDRRLADVEVGVRESAGPQGRLVFTIRARLLLHPGVDHVAFDAVLRPGSTRYEVSRADRRPAA